MQLSGAPGSGTNTQSSGKGNKEKKKHQICGFWLVLRKPIEMQWKILIFFTPQKQVWLGFILVSTCLKILIMIL